MSNRWPWLLAQFLLLSGACALGASAPAEQTAKQPQVRTMTIPVPDGNPGFYAFEPHIAADPEVTGRVLLGVMLIGKGKDARGTCLLAWQSEDGGRSWSRPIAPLHGPARARVGSDPVVAFGKGNACWFSGCDHDHLGTGWPGYSSIKVSLSEDGGRKWQPPIPVTELDNDKNGKGFVDKQWLAVDRGEGKRRGTLYVAWSRVDYNEKHTELRCAALPPGAKQFAPSVRLGEPFPSKGGNGLIHHVQLAVRPDGRLDAVWRVAPSSRLVHAGSQDGAKTFSKPAPISAYETIGTGEFPSLTATPDGNLLVAWGNEGNVLCSVLASGRWSVPRPVAGDLSEGVLSHQAVAATADALWVLAYRKEATPQRVSVVLYRSDGQGKKWEHYRTLAAREFPNGEARRFMPGDYVGLAAAKDNIYAAYVLPVEGREGAKRQLYVSALSMTKER